MISTDGINGPATVTAAVWCSLRQPRKRGVYQREGLQLTPAPSHFLARVIEGRTAYAGCSDLSPSTFCQSVPNPPMNVGDSWATIGRAAKLPNGSMRVFHGAGITDEEIAGQYGNSATTVWWIAGSGGGQGLWPATALLKMSPHCRRNPKNPHTEKALQSRPRHPFP